MFTLLNLTPQLIKESWITLSDLENSFLLESRWKQRNFLMDMDNKWLLSKVILKKEAIIGYLVTSQKTYSCCHLHRFVVDKNYRHNGLGSSILNFYCDFLKSYTKFLTLKVHTRDNPYESFYKKNNFHNIMTIEDHSLLIRTISY
jgi:GNAT superfamily N-acetyltransferase